MFKEKNRQRDFQRNFPKKNMLQRDIQWDFPKKIMMRRDFRFPPKRFNLGDGCLKNDPLSRSILTRENLFVKCIYFIQNVFNHNM